MKIKNKTFFLKTKKYLEFIDLTDQVKDFVKTSKIKNGQVLIYSFHTTLAIRINEKERGIINDFGGFMAKFLPKEKYYEHNDLKIRTENLVCSVGATDCLNGHSHCAHLLMGGTSEVVPIIDGKLALGQWQWIFAIELDSARSRKIIMQIMGE